LPANQNILLDAISKFVKQFNSISIICMKKNTEIKLHIW